MWYVLYIYAIYYVCIWWPPQKITEQNCGIYSVALDQLGPRPRGVGRKNCLAIPLCGESEGFQYVSGKTGFEVFTTPEMFRNYSIMESKKLTNWKLTSLWRTWASTICLWERYVFSFWACVPSYFRKYVYYDQSDDIKYKDRGSISISTLIQGKPAGIIPTHLTSHTSSLL